MSQLNLSVVAGARRETVGTITAREGLLTNKGRIKRVNEKTVTLDTGRRATPARLTVRHSEAYRNGYPAAEGCSRERYRVIVRDGQEIYA